MLESIFLFSLRSTRSIPVGVFKFIFLLNHSRHNCEVSKVDTETSSSEDYGFKSEIFYSMP